MANPVSNKRQKEALEANSAEVALDFLLEYVLPGVSLDLCLSAVRRARHRQ